MSFYLRLCIAWLCLLAFVFIVPGCASATFASDGDRGDEAAVTRIRGTALACTPRLVWKAGEPEQPGPAWKERRACAGEATSTCYQRLGDSATSAELTDCMAPLVEHCELTFRKQCGTAIHVANRQ